MIVAAFHVRGDEWIMPLKLASMESIADRIVVVLDRPSPELAAMVYARKLATRRYTVHVHENTLGLSAEGPDGPICEEGRMRQEAWDLAAAQNPDWILLGDADEVPKFMPDVLKDVPRGTCLLFPWVHLYKSPSAYVGGQSIWSPENQAATKKGCLVRYDPTRTYTYPDRYRHVRLEPEADPPLEMVEVAAEDGVLVHWKWVNWARWEASNQSRMPKYQRFWDGLEVKKAPNWWHA